MVIQCRCQCGQKLKIPDQAAGKLGRCPKCGLWLKIPQSFSVDIKEETAKLTPIEGSLAELKAELQLPGRVAAADSKGRVIVVDSHEGCRKDLASMLREHGYVVLEAQDRLTAVQTIRTAQPDAAIVDVKLDMGTGFRVVEEIRDSFNATNKAILDIPILMTTAALHGRDKQYAMHLGAVGYFVKPVAAAELFPKLEKAIRAYRRT